MSEKKEKIKRAKINTKNPSFSKTDWDYLSSMSEKEIHKNALSDSDNPPLTENELKSMKRVINVKEIRRKLHLSQSKFAKEYHLSIKNIQDWEQGRRIPHGPSHILLTAIKNDPKGLKKAISMG